MIRIALVLVFVAALVPTPVAALVGTPAQEPCSPGQSRLNDGEPCIPETLRNYLYCLSKTGGGKLEVAIKGDSSTTRGSEVSVGGMGSGVILRGKGSAGFKQTDANRVEKEISERIDPSLAARCQELSGTVPTPEVKPVKNSPGKPISSSIPKVSDKPKGIKPSPLPQRTPSIAGVWQHITEGVGNASWTFTHRNENLYDAQEEGLGNARGIAILKGNHLQIDFAAGGTTGRYQWDINDEFTSGVGTLEFFTESVETGIHTSRLIRIK